MKRAALAVGLAMSIALPAGLASARIARPSTPTVHPRVSTGTRSKSVKAGKSSARFQSRPSRTSVHQPKGGAKQAGKTKARTSTGSSASASNPSVGTLGVGSRQRRSGGITVSLGGNAKGTPLGRTKVGT